MRTNNRLPYEEVTHRDEKYVRCSKLLAFRCTSTKLLNGYSPNEIIIVLAGSSYSNMV